jgi:hypothetical protein
MNRNVVIGIVLLLVIGIGVVFLLNSDILNGNQKVEESNEMSGAPKKDESLKAVDEETAMEMKELLYTYSGDLVDVSGSNATGVAKSNWDGSQYLLIATFENLPEPVNDDFYEGWIVRKEPFEFISTGKAEMIDGVYTNVYRSDQDLTSYDFYVLTIEPNDGDPAPANHVLEGTMVE